jgi:hypothetical protein
MKSMHRRLGAAHAVAAVSVVLVACTGPPQSSGSTQQPVDGSNFAQLDKRVSAAIFQVADLPLDNAQAIPSISRAGTRLQHACNADIPSDSRIVVERADGWHSGRLVIDQTIQAYDRPIGRMAVRYATAALTCEKYQFLRATLDQIRPLEIEPPPAGEAFAFCERLRQGDGEATPCTVLVGDEDLACSVRATAPVADTAVSLLRRLLPAVYRFCLPPTTTPSISTPSSTD